MLFYANETKSASIFEMPDLEDTYRNYFEKRKSAMYFLEHLNETTNFLFYAKKFTLKDFEEKKNEYRTKGGADNYVYDLIAKQEEFYSATLPTTTTVKINSFIDALNEKKDLTKYSAKEAINACNQALEYIEGMLLLLPSDNNYLTLKEKNIKEKQEILANIESGEYEKKLNERTKEQVALVQINSAKMHDIYAEWAATESILNSNIGKTTMVSIISKNWELVKDESGNTINKYVDVEAFVKADNGKCFKVTGVVIKNFEKQENTFGKPIFKYQYKEEMSCDLSSSAQN